MSYESSPGTRLLTRAALNVLLWLILQV